MKKNIAESYLNEFWLGVLNSSVFWFFLKSTGAILRGGYFRFKTKYLEPFPLPKYDTDNQVFFAVRVRKIHELNSDFQKVSSKFLKLLQSSFSMPKVSKKLQKWHELEFEGFLKELKKAKVKLSLADKSEWMDFFESEKTKAQTLQAEIQKVDSEIDQMVYQLYGLTEEEIKIVENAV